MMSPIRILVVDDEVAIREALRLHLKPPQYELFEAPTAQKALDLLLQVHPHLVLLDLGLPDISGVEILKQIRKWSRVPVIVLSVQDDENSKVLLLESGADDYLCKPFSHKELQARIQVALRNIGVVEATPVFVSGDLCVDVSRRIAMLADKEIKLTNTEYELLALLVRDSGKVLSQKYLLKKIWGAATEDQSHYLRIYINQLRKKIEKNPSQPEHLITEPGVGYRLV